MEETTSTRYTCLKLQLPAEAIFMKGTWFHSHFNLSITNGLDAWVCDATEEEVIERAAQWDQPVTQYIELAEKHLGFQIPGSVYKFVDAGHDFKRLSWTFEKEGMTLEWRWKCKVSPDSKKTTAGILDFLMDANIRLSEEVVRKTQSFERVKEEAEKCLTQSERFCSEKSDFESAIFAKFVAVLNSKKRKLRELRDQLSKHEKSSGKLPQVEEESSGKTESFDEKTDDDRSEEESVEKPAAPPTTLTSSRSRGKKRVK